MGTGDKPRRHIVFELFRGATTSRGRARKKPHLVPLGTPHRRKRCDVQRLAVGGGANIGLGPRLHSYVGAVFIAQPDRPVPLPTSAEIAKCWEDVHTELLSRFKTLSSKEWLERHGNVSPEEFEQNPTRNRLSVLLGRTNHASYHLGQMMLAKPKTP